MLPTNEFLFLGNFRVKLVKSVVIVAIIIAAIPNFKLYVRSQASTTVHKVAYIWAKVIINPLATAGPIGEVIKAEKEYPAGKIGLMKVPRIATDTMVIPRLPVGTIQISKRVITKHIEQMIRIIFIYA